MRPNHSTISVLINIPEQQARREKIGGIYLDQRYIAMTRNLQYGPIVFIGNDIAPFLPGIDVGDIALFHHTIEDSDMALLETLDDGNEVRIVHPIPHEYDPNMSSQLYGVVKPNGDIIPFSSYVFLSNEIKHINEPIATNLIATDETRSGLLLRMDEMTRYRHQLEVSMKQSPYQEKRQDIYKEIKNVLDQQERITYDMNVIKRSIATVMFAASESQNLGITPSTDVLVDPELLYPLNINGISVFLIRNQYIDGIIKK